MGAWIETYNLLYILMAILSHPMWVRGLKLLRLNVRKSALQVAPHVGAWIETPLFYTGLLAR